MAVTDLLQSEIINYKGYWETDTVYNVGDYVYLKNKNPGFLYKCVQKGKSQSSREGTTGLVEPLWKFEGNTYDELLVWKAVKLTDIDDLKQIVVWKPRFIFPVGTYVCYANGKIPVIEQTVEKELEDGVISVVTEKVEYLFKLEKILVNHDWTKIPDEYQNDGSCIWQCHISIGYYLPKERLKEITFWEAVLTFDYLILHEKVYFDDYYYKFTDVSKIRTKSIKEMIAEQGFKYIADILNLDRKEYETLLKYLNIINDLKGHKSGLLVVFNILGISYGLEEWWEKDPQGVPHTFDFKMEVDIYKVSNDMIKKLQSFVRQYVYPVIENFEITYKMNIAEMLISMAGFWDIEFNTPIDVGFLEGSMGGFWDKEFDGFAEITDFSHFIVCGGFIDIEYICNFSDPLLSDTSQTDEESTPSRVLTNVLTSFGTAHTNVELTVKKRVK